MCRAQLVELQENLDRFEARGAIVLGISTDSFEDSAEWARSDGVEFPLVSDPEGVAIRAYGVRHEGKEIAVPSVFVVVPDPSVETGILRFRKIGESIGDRPDVAEILEALPSRPDAQPGG